MKDFDKNIFNLQDCLGHYPEQLWKNNRQVFGETTAPIETPEAEKGKEAAPLADLRIFENKVNFDEDRKKTFEDLAKNDVRLSQNFELALAESLNKAGYDKNVDDFWKELKEQYKCTQVAVKNSRILFLNDKNIEVAPKFSSIPIEPDLSRFHTDTPRTLYFNPDTGLVSLKDWKETRSVTIKDIVLNAKNGTEVLITARGSKKARKATFSENGEKAYYDDDRSVVKIFDGYKVELIRANNTEPSEKPRESAWGKYPSLGEFTYVPMKKLQLENIVKPGEQVLGHEGLSAEDFMKIALGLKEDAKHILDPNNEKLQKLRQLVKEKLYSYDDYAAFLKETNAIGPDRINLLIDSKAIAKLETRQQEQAENKRKAEYTNRLAGTQAGEAAPGHLESAERKKYYLPKNLESNVAFTIKNPKLLEAIDSEAKWRKAWDNNSIEGLVVLKGIITSEPDIFGAAAKNPNLIREKIRNAISNSRDDRIYFSDLLDDILDTRFPSYSQDKPGDKKVVDTMKTQGNFLKWYSQMSEDQKDQDQIEKAYGLLTCLGRNTLETATVIRSETDAVLLNIIFDNKAYTIKVNEGGAVGGEETVKFYHFGTETLLPDTGGFEEGLRFTVGTLTTADDGEKAQVQAEVRDALTPRMTYSRFMEVYKENFDANGNAKNPNINREWANRMRNIVIGGNRFLLQIQQLGYTEKSTGEMGRVNFQENRRGEMLSEDFLKIVDDDELWNKEWTNPTLPNTKQIKQAFLEDPVLREVMTKYPGEIAKRVQDSITTGKDEYLYVDDVLDYVLKGLRMPSYAPEARELPKGKRFSEYFASLKSPSDTDIWTKLTLDSLGAESASRAVIDSHSSTTNKITTTFENKTYTLVLRRGGLLSHMIEIQTPDGKAYPNSNGYSDSLEFLGNMGSDDSANILKKFRDAVTPELTASNFRDEYNKLFDNNGNPKAGVSADTASRFSAIMRAGNRLVMAFEGSQEHLSETSENTYASQLLRNADLEAKNYQFTTFYSADDIYSNYQSEGIYHLAARNTTGNGVGLQINDDILGKELEKLVISNKPALFRAVLQTYSLPQLISQGNIKKAIGNKPGREVYVIDNLPQAFTNFMQHKRGQTSNFEATIINRTNLSAPEYNENLNPQNKLHRVAEFFFPLKKSARSYEDVGAGTGHAIEEDRIYNRLDYTFAHTQFLKAVAGEETGNLGLTGPIDERRMMTTLQNYLELFDARLDLLGPEKSAKIRKEFQDVFGGQLPTINMAFIDSVMKDPEKSKVLIQAIHEGFLYSHENKIDAQRKTAIDTLKTNFEKWKESIPEAELEELRKALREQTKLPENQIPVAIEHMLPIWFGLGIDQPTGTVGVAVGVGFPIRLVFDGVNYGTITVGGGVTVGATGLGKDTETHLGVAVGAGTAYKTPHLGPFALFVGGGVGAGVDSEGTFGVGAGVGGGVSIEWGTVGATKISTDVGIAYVPGMAFPLPGITINFSKDHEASIRNLRKEAYEKFGLTQIESELATATTDAERKTIIGKNEYFRKAYEKGFQTKFEQAPAEDVVRAYDSYKAGITDAIRQDYDPALFWEISSITIGFGFAVDKDTGQKRFIFLLGGSLVTGKEVKSYAFEGKDRDVMNQEVQVAHWKTLIGRYEKGTLTTSEQSEVQTLMESGKLMAHPGSNDLAIFINRENPAEVGAVSAAPAPKPDETMRERIETEFNEKLKPLQMRVKYDESKKLYELQFNDWNDKTNYDIAVDTRMRTGGMVVEGGHIYLASTFDIGQNLTILRSDYEYPNEKSGKNYHTIVTLSDSPLSPAHEIYRSASEILSSSGGVWYRQKGLGFDQYAKKQPSSRFFNPEAALMQHYAFNEDKYKQQGNEMPTDDAPTKGYIDALSITPSEKGTLDEEAEKAITAFSKKFLRKHPLDYRKRSNKETLTNQFGDLNDVIIDEWKKDHEGKEPTPAELNEVRLKIMDESFSELGNIKSPEARKLAFRLRLEWTINNIIKPRFALLVERNHQKYQKGDPRYINNSVEDLTRIILTRIKTIDVNEQNGIPLSSIDRTSTVVGTLNIFGFRGNVYGADNKDPNQAMIGAGPNYAAFLKSNPTGYDADIARLIFEETSTMPARLEIAPDTAVEQIDKTKVYDLLRADLTQKIISNLFSPLSRNLFSKGVREEILRMAATKDKLDFGGTSTKALYELQNLVEGIRLAEMKGETYYIPANNPDYRFQLKYNVQDGVYKKCTNYSMWVNESFDLQMRTSKISRGPLLAAAYGASTGTTQTESGMEFSSINVAAIVAAGPKPEPPPPLIDKIPETPVGSEEGATKERAPIAPIKRIPIKRRAKNVHFKGPGGDSV